MPDDGFAGFALTAHANGEGNPNAMYRKAIKPDAYSKAPVVNEPLRQFDIAPTADGAAALLLARSDRLPADTRRPAVQIAGSASTVDSLALHDRQDILEFEACRVSVQAALQQAGIGLSQLNLFEYHDAFSIFAALALEAVGFADKGQGWKLAADGAIALGGRIPGATMGGLKARGFPGGATGVYHAVEASLQLQGRAGANQSIGCWLCPHTIGGRPCFHRDLSHLKGSRQHRREFAGQILGFISAQHPSCSLRRSQHNAAVKSSFFNCYH